MTDNRERIHWINLANAIGKQNDELRSVLHKVMKENNFYAPGKRLSGGRSWLEMMWFEALANATVAEVDTHLADILYNHRLKMFVDFGYSEDFVKSMFTSVKEAHDKDLILFDRYLIATDNKTIKGKTDIKEVGQFVTVNFKMQDLASISEVFDGYRRNIKSWLKKYDFVEKE